MVQPTAVEEEFRDRGVAMGSWIIFPSSVAIGVIARCKELGYAFLGFDAFHLLDDGSIQPSMEYSVDFTSQNFADQFSDIDHLYEEAIARIRRNPGELYYELVVEAHASS